MNRIIIEKEYNGKYPQKIHCLIFKAWSINYIAHK